MNDNLQEMIQEMPAEQPMTYNVDNLTLPETEVGNGQEASPDTTEVAQEATEPNPNEIQIVPFGEWFEKYNGSFSNIHQIQISARGVAPNENLIISIDDPYGEEIEEGIKKRRLQLFDDAMLRTVLDMEPSDMQIYNSGFRVTYPINDETFIKMYGIKTGIIAMFCHALEGGLLPYSKVVAKKKVATVEIQMADIEIYKRQLTEPIDMEALYLLYKQCAKTDPFETKGQAINWLIKRQDGITDINHHLEIDKTIMTLFS